VVIFTGQYSFNMKHFMVNLESFIELVRRSMRSILTKWKITLTRFSSLQLSFELLFLIDLGMSMVNFLVNLWLLNRFLNKLLTYFENSFFYLRLNLKCNNINQKRLSNIFLRRKTIAEIVLLLDFILNGSISSCI
jgi:small-conductance mechanosensitive channel